MQFADLYPFQQEGVRFLTTRAAEMNNLPHRALLDDPGLGKTPQACVAASAVGAKTILVICPNTIKVTWAIQLVTWGFCAPDEIQVLWTGKDHVNSTARVIIVNYELLLNNDIYRQVYWGRYDVGIVDEAHRLKNFTSQRAKRILGDNNIQGSPLISRCFWKWILTGTFMPNRPIELYPTLKVLAEPLLGKKYNTKEKFGLRFCGAFQGDHGEWNFNGASNLAELKKLIAPFILRRTIDEVFRELPDVLEQDIFCDVGDMAIDETNAYLSEVRREVGIAKIGFLVDYIQDRLAEYPEERLLVFAYHRDVIESLTLQLPAVKFYGGMSAREKEIALGLFQTTVPVLVAQIDAAGEGIDGLQHHCNNIVFAEVDWTPGKFKQMIGRLRRIGQQKPILAVKIIAQNTLDERVVGSSIKKQRNIDTLFNTEQEDQTMSLEQDIHVLALAADRIATALETLATDERQANGSGEPCAVTPIEAGKKKSTAKKSTTVSTPAETSEHSSPSGFYEGNGDATSPSAESSVSTAVSTLTVDDLRKQATAVMTKVIEQQMAKGVEKSVAQGAASEIVKPVIASTGAAKLADINTPELIAKAAAGFEAILYQLSSAPVASADPLAGL